MRADGARQLRQKLADALAELLARNLLLLTAAQSRSAGQPVA